MSRRTSIGRRVSRPHRVPQRHETQRVPRRDVCADRGETTANSALRMGPTRVSRCRGARRPPPRGTPLARIESRDEAARVVGGGFRPARGDGSCGGGLAVRSHTVETYLGEVEPVELVHFGALVADDALVKRRRDLTTHTADCEHRQGSSLGPGSGSGWANASAGWW